MKYSMSKEKEHNPICYYPKKDAVNRATRVSIKDSYTRLHYGFFPQTWYGYNNIDEGIHVISFDYVGGR